MTFKHINVFIRKIITHKATQNFIIIGLISLMQILSNVMLGRGLSKEDFGKFSFIIYNIIRVWSVLFLFGQNSSILRLFSNRDIQEYQWKKQLLFFFLFISFPLAIASFVAIVFYQLTSIMFVIIFFGSFLTCSTMILAAIYRSQGKFNIAVSIERTHAIIFMILLLYPYFIINKIDITTIIMLKLVSFFYVVPLFVYIFIKWKEGKHRITKDDFTTGLILWELGLSVLVLNNIDAFFIVKILDYKELALYSIIGSIMIVYDFVREAIFSVYSQKYAKIQGYNSTQLIKIVILVSFLLSIFYVMSTNIILKILFVDKYSSPILLLVLFCIYFSINILYVVPSCYFMGQGLKQELRKMMVVNIVSIVLKISFIFILSKYGLTGFLVAGIISQGFRTVGGYFIAFKRYPACNY